MIFLLLEFRFERRVPGIGRRTVRWVAQPPRLWSGAAIPPTCVAPLLLEFRFERRVPELVIRTVL